MAVCDNLGLNWGLKFWANVPCPRARTTIDNLPEVPNPLNGGLAASDRGEHGNEGDHHPGSDLHPEVIAG